MPDSGRTPLALHAYEQLADAYAAKIDTKAHNAYYERPATLSLLPDVSGLTILDAGCGPGAYSQWLLEHGAASIIAVDVSPSMLGHARSRNAASHQIQFHQADLATSDLPFIEDTSVDIVLAPLVMDYIADWPATFRRFHRVLKAGGLLIFSTGHPSFDAAYHKTERYFEVEQVSAVWRGFGPIVEVPCYRRSLTAVVDSVIDAGFELVRLLEPQPTENFRHSEPAKYEQFSRRGPCFLCIKAKKRAS
jgi:ubiquinone/menaquinone biosynthesis C-methylase UbiE